MDGGREALCYPPRTLELLGVKQPSHPQSRAVRPPAARAQPPAPAQANPEGPQVSSWSAVTAAPQRAGRRLQNRWVYSKGKCI